MSLNRLSASQILAIDEITADVEANKRTLDIALQFHSNRHNAIEIARKKFWKELLAQYNLPTSEGQEYTLSTIDGTVCVVLKGDNDG